MGSAPGKRRKLGRNYLRWMNGVLEDLGYLKVKHYIGETAQRKPRPPSELFGNYHFSRQPTYNALLSDIPNPLKPHSSI